ncbi:MAG: DNA alkylation repair protein, partial [Anaerolineae bacterium]|nr:DNA alkylation repair protein [Anaerolineae bacterium]
QPVLRRVLFELSPHVAADPQAALHLADALWAQYFIEFRLIAASILGMLTPLSPQDPLPRIQEWRAASDEDLLLDALAGDSLARYRQHNTPEFLTALSGWLGSSEIPDINFGLRALHAMLQSATYTNLPAIYRIIAPLFQNTAKVLRPFLLDILLLLAKQAPQETAFFLLQLLNKDKNPAAIWLVRHSLDAFPQKHQTNLRAALRG